MVQFNKMFVMLPVMFLARKLDSEDPNIVHWLRIAYACMQVICVAFVAYTYVKASAVKADRVVYVPAAPVVSFFLSFLGVSGHYLCTLSSPPHCHFLVFHLYSE